MQISIKAANTPGSPNPKHPNAQIVTPQPLSFLSYIRSQTRNDSKAYCLGAGLYASSTRPSPHPPRPESLAVEGCGVQVVILFPHALQSLI